VKALQIRFYWVKWMIARGGLNRLPGDFDRDQNSLTLQPLPETEGTNRPMRSMLWIARSENRPPTPADATTVLAAAAGQESALRLAAGNAAKGLQGCSYGQSNQ